MRVVNIPDIRDIEKAILENRISQELEEEYGLILTEDETEEKISLQIELWIEKSGLREKK